MLECDVEVVMRFGLMVVATAMVTVACGGGETNPEPHLVPITGEDAGTTVEVVVGDHLQVELESNASTGFSWVNETSDTSILIAVCEPEVVNESEVVGAPGVMECMFEAREPGEARIEMAYRRLWEEDAEPERVFTVTVRVTS
jgi:inhibitor of cysteine peptidase